MSHFNTLVFSHTPEQVDDLLAPFNECVEPGSPYGVFEEDDDADMDKTTGRKGYWCNPNAKWDWYEFSVYIKRLLGKGRKSCSVVTRFSLKKAVNAGGIAYSQAQFAVDRALTDAELPLILSMAEQVKQFATRVGYGDEPASAMTVDPETGEIIEEEPTARPLN